MKQKKFVGRNSEKRRKSKAFKSGAATTREGNRVVRIVRVVFLRFLGLSWDFFVSQGISYKLGNVMGFFF